MTNSKLDVFELLEVISNVERPIFVSGTMVTALEWKTPSSLKRLGISEETINKGVDCFDFSEECSWVVEQLTKCSTNEEPICIFIHGKAGTGKTMLAKVLAVNIPNAFYIEVPENNPLLAESIQIIHPEPSKTYIVDEMLYQGLYEQLEKHIQVGGKAICVTYDSRDIPCKYPRRLELFGNKKRLTYV